ncbi:MAG: flagellar functional protein, partial [Helicobacter sp.]|nr:flagellar functional protein [Helicobacter sp.]
DEDNPEYKEMLKNVAIWYDKSENFSKAHHYYQLLLEKAKDKREEEEIKELDDILLLKHDEDDAAKRLEHYEYVLKNYQGKEEAKMALEKKIETLFGEKRYEEIFTLRNELEENNPLLLEAVAALVRDFLSHNDCKNAAYYGNLYAEKIPLQESEKFNLLQCLYQHQQYIPAEKIAQEEIQKITKPEDKEKWLYYLGWTEYQLQNYPKAALASRDALNLLSKDEYNDIVWVLFMALNQEKRKEEAFNLLPILEEKLKNSDKMIEVYRIALLDALQRKDDTAIKIYAKKIIDLQDKYQRYEYSPWVELSFIEALNREGKFEEALQLLLQAQKHTFKPQEKIQVYYLQGYLNHKLNKIPEAIQAYGECEAVDIQSPWKNLCVDAKKLLENENIEKTNE